MPRQPANVLRTAVQTSLLAVFDVESKLRRDHDILAKRRERFANKFFIRERAVHLCRSKNDTPWSTAARISEMPYCLSTAGP